MAKIAVIGNINVDRVLRVNAFPMHGETKVASCYRLMPGGKGANQAVASSLLGAQVSLIGTVGNDEYGVMALRNLREKGVDASFVKTIEEPTGMAFVMSREDGANSIVSYSGANLMLTPGDVDRALEVIAWCDILLIQLGIPVATAAHAITTAKKLDKDIFLDPSPYSGSLPENIEMVTFLSPNEVELNLITGFDGEAAYACLHGMGVKTIVHKAGAEGCFISSGRAVEHVSTLKDIEVADTTGAGDTFGAAFSVSWASGADLKEAAIFANAAAGIAITGVGAQEAMPTYGQVMNFLKKAAI